ncbi:MAG: glycosyltransferase family 4 protein [Nitrospirota bacterium]
MEQKIKVLVMLTNRKPPSSRLRFQECRDDFLRCGIDADFIPIVSGPIGRASLILKTRQYNCIIIQKKTSFNKFELILMRFLNPNIIFDYDDAVMFHEIENCRPLSGKNLIKFLRTIRYCKAVVTGNEFLSEFAISNCQRVFVLPTPIDTTKYRMKDYYSKEDNGTVIGWIGVSGNLRYLKGIEPSLREISKRYPDTKLKIISNRTISIDGIRVIFKKWRIDEEIEDLRGIDIGIMPLDRSLWARGKCGYKILQYMGVGVPVIASPVGINGEIIRHGENGFLASTLEEWIEYIILLINSPEKRKYIGIQGRYTVEKSYSLKKYSENYNNVIRYIIDSIDKDNSTQQRSPI